MSRKTTSAAVAVPASLDMLWARLARLTTDCRDLVANEVLSSSQVKNSASRGRLAEAGIVRV